MGLDSYLRYMAQKGASDLFLTTGAPPSVKLHGSLVKVSDKPLRPGVINLLAQQMMDDEQKELFEENHEMNLAVPIRGVGRFRVNIYRQRGETSMVVRYIKSNVPSLNELQMPDVLKTLASHKSGLLLAVGATGTGKSTTLAAMVDYRNEHYAGHILTIEDPIEFMFSHKRSIVGQREVGIDTLSYANALREAMREAPDVIMIGEIRDEETMKAALSFADTGHLVLSTLHAVNANQALERIVNFFPNEAHNQVYMDLALNLRGVISQRLVPGLKKPREAAIEVLLNTPFVSELIQHGDVGEIKEVMEKSTSSGMRSFDQSLFELYDEGRISLEEALTHADSRNNLEWKINFGADTPAAEKKPGRSKGSASASGDDPLAGLDPLSQTMLIS